MASLTFDFAQTVAVGPFNPHIITPDWLVDEKVAAGRPDDYDSFPSFGDDDGFVLGGFEWEVSLSRLAVTSREPGGDCGAKAAEVMGKLQHTPVRAVGNNFVFTCSPAEWGDRPVPKGPAAPPGLTPVDTRWVRLFRIERAVPVSVEVDLLHSPQVVVVQLNYDRRADGSKGGRAAANEFRNDQAHARGLIKHLFDIEVTS